MRIGAWLGALAALVVVLYAKEAFLSGSHFIQFLEPSFVYEYEDEVRKIFRSGDGADEYFEAKRQHSRRVFVAALPLFSRFFQEARKHGIELGELPLRALDPQALYGGALQSAEPLTQKDATYPRVVKLHLQRVDKDRSGTTHLTLWLQKAPDRKQAAWLWEKAAELRYETLAQRETEIQAVSEDALKQFVRATTLAAARVGKDFALSVGTTGEIRTENQRWLSAQTEALTAELFPVVQRALKDEALRKQFFTGDNRRLVSLDAKLGKRTEEAALLPLFNPHGPLSDELGMRTAEQVGGLRVTLLFVVKDRWRAQPGDPDLTTTLSQWLRRAAEGPARPGDTVDRLLQTVQKQAGPDHDAARRAVDDLLRLAKEPALRAVGGQRIIDFFVQHALAEPVQDAALRKLAIENLRWIDCPERRRVYLEILKKRRLDDAMGVIAQALGDLPDDETTTALIAAATDAAVPQDHRSMARYGLKSQLARLEGRTGPGNTALRDRIKRTLAEQP